MRWEGDTLDEAIQHLQDLDLEYRTAINTILRLPTKADGEPPLWDSLLKIMETKFRELEYDLELERARNTACLTFAEGNLLDKPINPLYETPASGAVRELRKRFEAVLQILRVTEEELEQAKTMNQVSFEIKAE